MRVCVVIQVAVESSLLRFAFLPPTPTCILMTPRDSLWLRIIFVLITFTMVTGHVDATPHWYLLLGELEYSDAGRFHLVSHWLYIYIYVFCTHTSQLSKPRRDEREHLNVKSFCYFIFPNAMYEIIYPKLMSNSVCPSLRNEMHTPRTNNTPVLNYTASN